MNRITHWHGYPATKDPRLDIPDGFFAIWLTKPSPDGFAAIRATLEEHAGLVNRRENSTVPEDQGGYAYYFLVPLDKLDA